MQIEQELTPQSLAVLKEILLTEWASDRAVVGLLLNAEMVRPAGDCRLQLTDRGRTLLVRGSPALWSFDA
jgi:hypothetical protein